MKGKARAMIINRRARPRCEEKMLHARERNGGWRPMMGLPHSAAHSHGRDTVRDYTPVGSEPAAVGSGDWATARAGEQRIVDVDD